MDVPGAKSYLRVTGLRECDRDKTHQLFPKAPPAPGGLRAQTRKREMERPGHAIPVKSRQPLTPTRIASLGVVGLLHVMLIYALATGLAVRMVKQLPRELVAQVIEPQQPKPEPPPPVQVDLAKPALPSVQVPVVKIAQPHVVTHAITTIVAPPRPQTPAAPVVTKPEPPPPAPSPASSIARTHTIPPYPDQARRLGQQGTVRLKIDVATDGSVSDASIVNSSGSDVLDEAAVAWVKDHWRYKPATQDGHAVATSVQAAVVFNLKNAGAG